MNAGDRRCEGRIPDKVINFVIYYIFRRAVNIERSDKCSLNHMRHHAVPSSQDADGYFLNQMLDEVSRTWLSSRWQNLSLKDS